MPLIRFPTGPPGVNPYDYFARYLDAVFNPPPTQGFEARLIVLWMLTGYGILASAAYTAASLIDSRRRGKSLWLFKFVRRPAGRYLVGNSHLIFSLASFLVCTVLLGYLYNFYCVALLKTGQSNAFFWRTLIWLPLGGHLWFSSWSSLQASLLATQSACMTRFLSPVVTNALYLGGLLVLLVCGLTLDIVISIEWNRVWRLQRRLAIRSLLFGALRPNDSVADARTFTAGALGVINDELDKTVTLMRAIGSIYSVASAIILAANIGGLVLLLILRRQIQFNTDRFQPASSRRAEPVPEPPQQGETPSDTTPESRTPVKSAAGHTFLALPRLRADSKASQQICSPIQHVQIAQEVQQHSEYLESVSGSPSHSSSSDEENVDPEPGPQPAARPVEARLDVAAERQLAALRKVHADVAVFSIAIAMLACLSLGTGLWLAISPTSVYGRFYRLEAVYFALVWGYLVGIDIALTLLLYNTLSHLPSKTGANPTEPLPPVLFLPAIESEGADISRTPFDRIEMRET